MSDSTILFLIAGLLLAIAVIYKWPIKCARCGGRMSRARGKEYDQNGNFVKKFPCWICLKCGHSVEV